MKKLCLINLFLFVCVLSFAQVKMPAPSPTQIIKQDFAIGNIELKYSRPSAKGRKVFGELVQYNKLWRTGANAATVITFSDPVEINGKKLDSGSYAIYTIPNLESWEIIFNKGINNAGVSGYKESDDVIRVKAETKNLKNKLETFTIDFDNMRPESCDMNFMWEKTLVTLNISTNIKEKLKSQIEAALQSDKKPYWQAAQFYTEYESNSAKALENVTKALAENPKAYWMWLYKAKIQQEMGDFAGAKESSKKSLELATEEKNDDYIRMNQALLKKLK
ncbi:MAG: DUF2911 domain-containing protein [Bacteroidetes bacterium]|jgi:tetratricopeptide (TPR) repeat protein|nr:DUF2911 domain-containing protein [Bacteroidota bacterium]